MEELLENIASAKKAAIKEEIRKMVLAEAERAFVYGSLQSEEDDLVKRLAQTIVPTWNIYKEQILEPKLKDWGLGLEE